MEAEIDALFGRTLEGAYEDHASWEAVSSLRRIGTREVFEQAAKWTESDVPRMRARGLDVLAQLGKTVEHPSNNFPSEAYDVVTRVLQVEREFEPLNSALAALGHLEDERAVPLIASYRSDARTEIRFTVACALGSFPNDALAVATLITLSEDADDDVRDWATFGLGVLGDVDSAQVRAVLYRRMDDTHLDVREEALVGLAKRHDERILPSLLGKLKESSISYCTIEAAYKFLDMEADREDWSGTDYANALRQRFPDTLG